MPFNFEMRLALEPEAEGRVQRIIPEGAMVDAINLHVPKGHQGLQPVTVEIDGARFLPSDVEAYRLDNVPDRPLISRPVYCRRKVVVALVGRNEDVEFPHTTTLSVSGRYANEVAPHERR